MLKNLSMLHTIHILVFLKKLKIWQHWVCIQTRPPLATTAAFFRWDLLLQFSIIPAPRPLPPPPPPCFSVFPHGGQVLPFITTSVVLSYCFRCVIAQQEEGGFLPSTCLEQPSQWQRVATTQMRSRYRRTTFGSGWSRSQLLNADRLPFDSLWQFKGNFPNQCR